MGGYQLSLNTGQSSRRKVTKASSFWLKFLLLFQRITYGGKPESGFYITRTETSKKQGLLPAGLQLMNSSVVAVFLKLRYLGSRCRDLF